MHTPKHTPLPWKIHSLVRYENPTPEIKSFDRFIECEPTSADQEYAEIAVNAHAELVEACKIAQRVIKNLAKSEETEAYKIITEALAKAGVKL